MWEDFEKRDAQGGIRSKQIIMIIIMYCHQCENLGKLQLK